jgi:stage V sporulation protein K
MSELLIQTEPRKITQKTRQINVVFNHAESKVLEAEAKPNIKANAKAKSLSESCSDIFKELDQMVGLEKVKELVYEIYALLQIRKFRQEQGLKCESQVYHMIFKGNPGTGKTTVARIAARLLQQMGILSKGHFIEVERADLVGEYIGHTAVKTRELVKKAMGGILFIDEAYSLARGGEKDFGKECIDSLVKAMEDNKDQFVLILAGYPEQMDDFLKTNPGLPSRFPLQIDFPDYSIDELIEITDIMIKEREYRLLPQTVMKLKEQFIQEKQGNDQEFSNARYVRNQIEKAIRNQAVRLMSQYDTMPTRQELMQILPEDLKE